MPMFARGRLQAEQEQPPMLSSLWPQAPHGVPAAELRLAPTTTAQEQAVQQQERKLKENQRSVAAELLLAGVFQAELPALALTPLGPAELGRLALERPQRLLAQQLVP
jgi:hypothetical protein